MKKSVISGADPRNPQIQKLTVTPAMTSPHILSLPEISIPMFSSFVQESRWKVRKRYRGAILQAAAAPIHSFADVQRAGATGPGAPPRAAQPLGARPPLYLAGSRVKAAFNEMATSTSFMLLIAAEPALPKKR